MYPFLYFMNISASCNIVVVISYVIVSDLRWLSEALYESQMAPYSLYSTLPLKYSAIVPP